MNFVFYDFETTGISTRYDQALQFAAIQTDAGLNPLDGKEIDIRCNLAGHILPSPIALAVTKVTPERLIKHDQQSYYEFSREISTLIDAWGSAIWTGYNTIRFDENVIRNMFYQNLEPNIYKTITNGNKRFDILNLVYAAWATDSPCLSIPTRPDGKPTSKLDTLAPHNGFNGSGEAHDALEDVRMTIFIAKQIKQHDPVLWNNSLKILQQEELLQNLKSGQVYDIVERFGGAAPSLFRGTYVGTNPNRPKNIGLVKVNTGIPEDFWAGDESSVTSAVEESPKLVRSLDLNKSQILLPVTELSGEEAETASRAYNNLAVHEAVGLALRDRYADTDPAVLVEDKIFDGFYSDDDKKRLRDFHASPWYERYQLIETFEDKRLKELALRLIILNCPEVVPDDLVAHFKDLIKQRWAGEVFYGDSQKNSGNTFASVDKDLNELAASDQFDISEQHLEALRVFFANRRPLD